MLLFDARDVQVIQEEPFVITTDGREITHGIKHYLRTWSKHEVPIHAEFFWHIDALAHDGWPIYVPYSSVVGKVSFSKKSKDGHLFKEFYIEDGRPILQPIEGGIEEGVFLQGRAMQRRVPVRSCETQCRPKYLFRAIHAGYAENGLKARDPGCVPLNDLNIQLRLEHYLVWSSEYLSPFLSTTCDGEDAKRRCHMFKSRGYFDIRLYVINMERWGEEGPLVWKCEELVNVFGMDSKPYYRGEYLVERYIPEESVVRRWELDSDGDFVRTF